MSPLGHFDNFESFSKEFGEVLSHERAVGFLLDCPKSFSLDKSGLINSSKSVQSMDELMGNQMSIYYLSPRNLIGSDLANTKEYRNLAARFNEEIVKGLNLKFKVEYPCLILFRPKENSLGDRLYIDLGKDSCFYFSLLHAAISGFLDTRTEEQTNGLVRMLSKGFHSAKEEIPKTVFLKTMEFGVGGLVALAASYV